MIYCLYGLFGCVFVNATEGRTIRILFLCMNLSNWSLSFNNNSDWTYICTISTSNCYILWWQGSCGGSQFLSHPCFSCFWVYWSSLTFFIMFLAFLMLHSKHHVTLTTINYKNIIHVLWFNHVSILIMFLIW